MSNLTVVMILVFWGQAIKINSSIKMLRYVQLSSDCREIVFSVNLVCKKELNLLLKVSEDSSQGAVGFELRGTGFFLPILYDLNNK